jgi:phosphoribosylformylglycinamidine synthase
MLQCVHNPVHDQLFLPPLVYAIAKAGMQFPIGMLSASFGSCSIRPRSVKAGRFRPEVRFDGKNFLATFRFLTQHDAGRSCGSRAGRLVWFEMKAKIIVTPKKAVVDPQGKTVQNALEHMGYRGIKAVHVGKYLEIELDGGDREAARQQLTEAAHKFLTNPVIEDYKLEISD